MALMLANAGHLFSPMVLLGVRADLRERALRQPGRHFLLPALAVYLSFVAPLAWVLGAYSAWNIYHYAMQHNGFWALTRWRAKTRNDKLSLRTLWLLITIGAMQVPILQWPLAIFHWLGDVGLSGMNARRWALFVVLVCVCAISGFIIMDHRLLAAYEPLVRLRFGAIASIHFILSGLIWPTALRSDWRGRELLSAPRPHGYAI
jgi:hypothetical protein